MSDNIYGSQYNVVPWQILQRKLTNILHSVPELTPQQQTLQNSIHSQNESLKKLFFQITQNKLKNASLTIKSHLKERMMTQLEAIRSDSLQLAAIAHNDILSTIKKGALFIISFASISIFILLVGSFTLSGIVRKSLLEVKQAFKKNHSGHFEKIKLTYPSEEFETIANSFNEMNEKLSETTVSLTVMKKAVEERTHVLELLSNTDPLTKVANRRSLFERANIEFSRAKRNKSQLTLLLLDCDLFKSINDEYGHLIGDDFLIRICDVCRQEVRDIDFVARYGGEEFILVLPHCDIAGGIETANRIQQSLAKQPMIIKGKKLNVTLSIGVSMFNERHENLEQLINDADNAMYQAKKNGRNRIEVISSTSLH